MTREKISAIIPEFTINTETCIQCRMCEQNCPVHGIDIDAEPPHSIDLNDPLYKQWQRKLKTRTKKE